MGLAYDFSALASRYAAYRPGYARELVDAIADACAARDVVWDAGCGSGQLAVGLAARFARVIATDPAPAQVAAAEACAGVEYRVSAAEASGLADASVDCVTAAQAAHWFHWQRFCAEAARVARPGALLVVISYGRVDADGELGELMHAYERDVAPWWPPERHHVDDGYRDLAWPWPAVELRRAPGALRESWTRDELFGYATTWSATARQRAATGDARLEQLRAELERAWPDGDARREIRWPLVVKACRYAP
jgi:SAM-dependent methyltransferase|nr:class I SAM-dependent methyltransferase [Kofleriaceae bacterium]